MDSNEPIHPGPTAAQKRPLYGLVGILFLFLAIPVAAITWSLLPAGHYPVLIAVIPALPFSWVAWHFFQRAGWGTHVPEPVASSLLHQPEGAHSAAAHRMAAWKLWLIAAAVGFLVLVAVAVAVA